VSIDQLKLLLALGTLVIGAAGGLAPILGSGQSRSRFVVGAGNAFAAGLFLAIGMLHFLPESAAAFVRGGVLYPASSLLAVGAFLILLLLEHVLLPDAAHDAAHAHSGEGRHSHGGGHGHEVEEVVRASPYVLVVALSIHSVLAGLALGAEADAEGALLTFLAIAIHKGTAGLALGLALMSASTQRRKALTLTALFAAMTPLGIFVGTAAGGLLRSDAQVLFDAGAGALAAGTFLYIGAFDLVQDEFLRAGRRWTKWVSAVVGAATAALLAVWL